jgi:hypothetical protein
VDSPAFVSADGHAPDHVRKARAGKPCTFAIMAAFAAGLLLA